MNIVLHSLGFIPAFLSTKPVAIASDAIHVWSGSTADASFIHTDFSSLATKSQRQEAALIKNEQRRKEYLYIRACLNTVLSCYTGLLPESHQFSKSSSGKPYLSSPAAALHFNLSHSQQRFLIAVSNCEIGIDLEFRKRHLPEWHDIIERYFSPEEQSEVKQSACPEETFLQIWTRKEAVVKCLGTGIHENLKSINTRNVVMPDKDASADIMLVYSGTLNEFFFSIASPLPAAQCSFYSANDLF